MKKRTLTILIAVVLVVVCAIGGTLAWLTDETDPVTNTFTAGDVDITLIETFNPDGSSNEDGSPVTGWSAQMIPGETYHKNPVVTVTDETNTDCYLFVKFEENGNPANYLDYVSTLTVENGWTQGNGTDIPSNVWYRVVNVNDTDKSWHLLKDDEVTVKADKVTKDNMSAAAEAKLVYTAYAVQKDNISSASEAWSKLPTTTTP